MKNRLKFSRSGYVIEAIILFYAIALNMVACGKIVTKGVSDILSVDTTIDKTRENNQLTQTESVVLTENEDQRLAAYWDLIELYIEQHADGFVEMDGSIGPYPIHMYLNPSLEGYYYYDAHPKNRFKLRISRKGVLMPEEYPMHYYGGGQLELQEFTNSGKNSAEFTGNCLLYKFRMYDENGHIEDAPSHDYQLVYEGVFRNKSNGKTYDFELISDWFTLTATQLKKLGE